MALLTCHIVTHRLHTTKSFLRQRECSCIQESHLSPLQGWPTTSRGPTFWDPPESWFVFGLWVKHILYLHSCINLHYKFRISHRYGSQIYFCISSGNGLKGSAPHFHPQYGTTVFIAVLRLSYDCTNPGPV